MNKGSNAASLTILGLLIGLIGIVAPIVWDWWSEKAELSVVERQFTVILRRDGTLPKLGVTYDGKDIESLSQIVLAVSNTGRTAITRADVARPVTISFPHAEILTVSSVAPNPPNAEIDVTAEAHSLQVSFPLLNPEDEVTITVLLNGLDGGFEAEARIRNLPKVSTPDPTKQLQLRSGVGWVVYVVGVLGLVFLIATFGLFSEAARKKRVIEAIRAQTAPFNNASLRAELMAYMMTELRFLSGGRKKRVKRFITSCDEPLAPTTIVDFGQLVVDASDEEASLPGALTALAFTIAAGWYVFSKVFV